MSEGSHSLTLSSQNTNVKAIAQLLSVWIRYVFAGDTYTDTYTGTDTYLDTCNYIFSLFSQNNEVAASLRWLAEHKEARCRHSLNAVCSLTFSTNKRIRQKTEITWNRQIMENIG